MKAGVLRAPRQLEFVDIPEPVLEPGQVEVAVKVCTICGSDVRYFHGENPWALHTLGKPLANPPNIILGHEFAGIVISAADEAGRHLVGKRVGVLAFRGCGECPACRRGRENLCPNTIHLGHGAGWGKREYYPGGMAERCAWFAELCVPIPDEVSFEEAALADAVGVGVHAARLAEVREGMSVMAIGCGPVGNAAAQVSLAMGARRAFAADVYDVALELAESAGCTVFDGRDDFTRAVLDETGGAGCDVVFDSVGTQESFQRALGMLAEEGTLVAIAVHGEELSFRGIQLCAERKLITSSNWLYEEYPMAMEFLRAGKVRVKKWITHRFPLASIGEAFDVMLGKTRRRAFKVAITVGPGSGLD